MSFSTLVYRYFFYGWLFRDVSCGTVWQRSAAWCHNRAQARWLPTYMRRWLVCGGLLFAAAWCIESVLGCTVASALLYVPSVLVVPFNAVTALCWACLVHNRPI